jgi:DNA mismatch repair protein MutS2
VSEGEAEVQVGGLRVRTRLEEIEPVFIDELTTEKRSEPPATAGQKTERTINPHPSPGIELDLRGRRADEAQDELERYLDAAYLAGLPFVRIIHGKGTGKIREVVRKALSGYSNIRSVEAGGEREGGDGVTIAKFGNS